MIDKTTNIPGGVYDRRPAQVEGLLKRQTSAFYLDQSKNISIRNCSANWGNTRPAYFAHVLESHAVVQLTVNNLTGDSAFPGKIKAIQKY
jgi:hypothetical protein